MRRIRTTVPVQVPVPVLVLVVDSPANGAPLSSGPSKNDAVGGGGGGCQPLLAALDDPDLVARVMRLAGDALAEGRHADAASDAERRKA